MYENFKIWVVIIGVKKLHVKLSINSLPKGNSSSTKVILIKIQKILGRPLSLRLGSIERAMIKWLNLSSKKTGVKKTPVFGVGEGGWVKQQFYVMQRPM